MESYFNKLRTTEGEDRFKLPFVSFGLRSEEARELSKFFYLPAFDIGAKVVAKHDFVVGNHYVSEGERGFLRTSTISGCTAHFVGVGNVALNASEMNFLKLRI